MVVGCWLLVVSCLLVVGWLLVGCCWLLVVACCLLAVGKDSVRDGAGHAEAVPALRLAADPGDSVGLEDHQAPGWDNVHGAGASVLGDLGTQKKRPKGGQDAPKTSNTSFTKQGGEGIYEPKAQAKQVAGQR